MARKEEVVELPIFRQAQFDHNKMRRWSREMVFGQIEMMAFGKYLTKTKAFDYKGG